MFQVQRETHGFRPRHECKMPGDVRPAVLASMLAKFVERKENPTHHVDFFFLQSPKFLQTPKRSALHHLGLIR
jgi:hypothetical protein